MLELPPQLRVPMFLFGKEREMEYSKVNTYIKKPVAITAIQWTGKNEKQVIDFCSGNAVLDRLTSGETELYIATLEDGGNRNIKHLASINDFIIKGVNGEFYPCKPDIFFATYKSAEYKDEKRIRKCIKMKKKY